MAAFVGRMASRGIGLGKALFTTGPGLATLATAGVGHIALQSQFGTGKDFFHHKFTTTKNADKIVDFYSTEEFLQILGIFNFATNFVLAGVVWATDTDQKNTVWNMMEISFDITEREQKLDDGSTVVAFFNKRERFKNYIPYTNILLWDQVQNYGYRRRSDGVIEVQHHGESFYGPWPVRLLVNLHAYYVIWATEKHINSELFGTDDLEALETQRENIPLAVMSEFIANLKAEQQNKVLENKMKLEDASKTDELKSTQAELAAEQDKLEATLAKLNALESKTGKLQMQTTTNVRGKGRLQRMSTTLHVDDPAANAAIKEAMEGLGKTEGGRNAVAGLLKTHKTAA